MQTFSNLFQSCKDRYVYKHGHVKFNKIESILRKSSKLADLQSKSMKAGLSPTGIDYSATIQSIGYFMLSGAETSAMAELIAIDDWNRKVNLTHRICSDQELLYKAESRLRKWQVSI